MINRKREQLPWSASKALLKNQFLDSAPDYLPSKVHQYILNIFIDLEHFSLNLSHIFFSSFHAIILGCFIVFIFLPFFFLLFSLHVRRHSFIPILQSEFVSFAFLTEQCYITYTHLFLISCSLFKEPPCPLFSSSLFSLSLSLALPLLLNSSAPISNNKKKQTK